MLIHSCNSGTKVMRVTTYYMIRIKPHSKRWNPCPTLPRRPRTEEQIGYGQGKIIYYFFLKECSNKMTSNNIMMYSQIRVLLSHHQCLPEVDGNKYRDIQQDKCREQETLEHLYLTLLSRSNPSPQSSENYGKRDKKILRASVDERHQGNKAFQAQQD